MKKIFAVFCAVLSFATSTAAVNPSRSKNFLSSTRINVIVEDSLGRLIIGTEDGLVSYDGYNIKMLKPDCFIEDVSPAPGNKFLIRTYNGFYFLMDGSSNKLDENFTAGFNVSPSMFGNAIYSDRSAFWLVNDTTCTIIKYLPRKHHGEIYKYDESYGSIISKDKNSPSFLTSAGEVIRIENSILKIYDGLKGKHFGEYSRLFIDSRGTLFCTNTGNCGLLCSYPGRLSAGTIDKLKNVVVNDICEDERGYLWIATDHGGVIVIHPDGTPSNTILRAEGLSGSSDLDNVLCLYEDRHMNMWMGEYKKGLSYCFNRNVPFREVELDGKSEGMPFSPDIDAVLCKGDTLWLGTNKHGIICYDYTGKRILRKYSSVSMENRIASDVVVSLCKGSDGGIWAGHYWGGLSHIHGGHVEIFRHKPGCRNSLSNDNVWSLYNKDGLLWIGTLGGGLQSFDPVLHKFKTYLFSSNSTSSCNYVVSVCGGRPGSLYVATVGGIFEFDIRNHSFEPVEEDSIDESFRSHNDIVQIFFDSRKLLWILSKHGIMVYDTSSESLVWKNETSGDMKYASLGEASDGHMWVAGSGGLLDFNIRKDDAGNYLFDREIYGRSSGLVNTSFNQRSVSELIDGNLLFGSSAGLTYVIPYSERTVPEKIKIYFGDLQIDGNSIQKDSIYNGRRILGKSLWQTDRIKLSYKQNMISLNVFTDELSFSGEKQFKYRLIGNNENWINLMPGANVIPLMNLPSGDYELQVEMAECSRLIRCEPAVLFITIGRPFWKQWWAFIMYFVLAGGIALFIYYNIKHDIRQQYMIKQVSYEAAREKELSDMRLQFFMDTSHEIRTPLSLMLGPVRQCIKSDDIGNIKSKLVMVESNGRQLLKLVNQILDYRKFDATGLCANITEGDVSMGMEKMLGGFGYMIRSSGAIITYTSDCAGCICSYDEDFMDKIADNLITNSLKYGGKGVKINLSCNIGRPAGSEEDCIILKISDDGPGIADDEKQHVFERFYRSKKTEKGFAVQQGTGIGLFMVKHYVELMNGTILLEDNNAAGHGCIFTIKIPSMVTDSSLRETKKIIFDGIENEDEEKNAAVSLAPVHNEMIMIVDDNPDFRKYIADIMNPYYHLEMASGGKEAWEKIPGLHPDLVIADQMMPEMDGMELCRRIKESPETSQIPVIILTACADDKNRLEGLQSGADEYLTKPFEWDILNMCIEYLIKQNRLKKEKIMYRSYVSPITSDLAPTDIKLLSDALRYVQDNIKDTALSVEGLSLHLGISRGYLYKKIDYMTGRSVVEFIRLVRLRTAAAMLKEGLLNVSQVAYSVGFNNVKYFSKYFKDEYGITPSMYRKS